MGVLVHGTRIVQMLDGALTLLGPDIELFEEILGQVGQRHEELGVKKEHYAMLGVAVREVISSIIGNKFTDEDDEAWKEVFSLMTAAILKIDS
jgi:hemoglobin-like flavoprotein